MDIIDSSAYRTAQNLLKELRECAAEIDRAIQAVRDGDHLTVIRHYDEIRKSYDIMQDVKKSYNTTYDATSKEYVPDAMRRAEVKTVSIEGIGRVSVAHRFSCSMVPDKKDLAMDWLRTNGHGGLIQETVNAQTLGAFAKDLIQNEGKELPDDLFKVGTSPYTSITKV